jgi:omega-6 fatty acid desaturase (delta-12 desaturase)
MTQGTRDLKKKENTIDLSGYAKPDAFRSVFQLLITLFLFVGFWYAMFISLSYPYWVTMLLAIPTAGFVVRLFIIQHDAGHGSFFRSGKANDLVGSFLGVITLTPYHYWKRTHNIHHATSGNLDKRGYGDIDTLTVDEYRALPVKKQLFYRIYRNPVAMFIIGPSFHFVLKHRHPWDIPFSWKKEWKSVHFTNAVVVVVALVAWNSIGMEKFLQVQAPVTFLAASMGAWMFFIQHQFEDSYWERSEKWDFYAAAIKGCSYYKLPGILRWFTGNIGLHHVHHYNSRIPNYRLNECYEQIPQFQEATEITMLESVSLIRLALWDEESGKLVGFNTQ